MLHRAPSDFLEGDIMRTLRGSMSVATSLMVVAALMAGCSSSDDGGSMQPGTPIASGGSATKGGIAAATVNLYRFTAAGATGALMAGPFTTDSDGAWSGDVPAGTNEPLLVVVDGGSYTDESTGGTVDLTSPMYGLWSPTTARGNASPVTHAMVLNLQKRVVEGASVAAATAAATAAMQTALGFDATAVAPAVLPTKGRETSAEIYAAFLAGFSALLDGNPALSGFTGADPWDLVLALAQDLSDGVLQGVDIFGNAILVDPDGAGGMSPIQLPVLDADDVGALIDAANAWATANSLDITVPAFDLSDFGEIVINPGGGTASGTLNPGGPDAAVFGSPYTPTSADFADGGTFYVIGFLDGDFRNFNVSVMKESKLVFQAGASSSVNSWALGGIPGTAISGIAASQNGNTWTFSCEGLTLPPYIGATGNLTLNGTVSATLEAGR